MVGATPERRQILRRGPLFARLPNEEIDAILKYAAIRRYAANAQIVCKGDPGSTMMAVLRGRVVIRAPSSEGKEVILNIINAGEIFGEIALLDGKERTADATAMTDCELLVVARRSFLPLLERPVIARELLSVLCERLRRTTEQTRRGAVSRCRGAHRADPTSLRGSWRCTAAGRARCPRHVPARARQSCWRVAGKSEQTTAGVAARRDHCHREGDDFHSRSGRAAISQTDRPPPNELVSGRRTNQVDHFRRCEICPHFPPSCGCSKIEPGRQRGGGRISDL